MSGLGRPRVNFFFFASGHRAPRDQRRFTVHRDRPANTPAIKD
jgi:hypothetical protein